MFRDIRNTVRPHDVSVWKSSSGLRRNECTLYISPFSITTIFCVVMCICSQNVNGIWGTSSPSLDYPLSVVFCCFVRRKLICCVRFLFSDHMCARPVEPINGVMTGSSTYVGDTFEFRCHAGYHLIGPSVITCISFDQYHAVWDNGFPRCDASQPQQPFVEIG